jgi:hypothetical protein
MTFTSILILAGAILALGFAGGVFQEMRDMTVGEALKYTSIAFLSLGVFIAAFWVFAFLFD